MDRPMCKTCPYWMPTGHTTTKPGWWVDPPEGLALGQCRHSPPPAAHHHAGGVYEHGAGQPPLTNESFWCGQHPDFLAHIATTRKPKRKVKPTAQRIVKAWEASDKKGIATMRDIAEEFNLTRQRVRQILADAGALKRTVPRRNG